MSDGGTVDALATVPLFQGWEQADLIELGRVMRRKTAQEGEFLWRQGDEPREMVFVLEGGLSASLRVAGGGAMEIGRAGPGEMVGEIALVHGGPHTVSVSVTETAAMLVLGRQDLVALLSRRHPSAFSLKRRLASFFTARLRNQLRQLAGPFGDELAGPPTGLQAPEADLRYCNPPSTYLRRMATFHDFDRLAVWGFLTSGRYARCAPGGGHRRRGGAVDGLLPDDQRRGREGDDPWRPAHPRRSGRAGEGVRLRGPDRRPPVPGHRDRPGAGAPAGAAW